MHLFSSLIYIRFLSLELQPPAPLYQHSISLTCQRLFSVFTYKINSSKELPNILAYESRNFGQFFYSTYTRVTNVWINIEIVSPNFDSKASIYFFRHVRFFNFGQFLPHFFPFDLQVGRLIIYIFRVSSKATLTIIFLRKQILHLIRVVLCSFKSKFCHFLVMSPSINLSH